MKFQDVFVNNNNINQSQKIPGRYLIYKKTKIRLNPGDKSMQAPPVRSGVFLCVFQTRPDIVCPYSG